jgi:hypothetical protein
MRFAAFKFLLICPQSKFFGAVFWLLCLLSIRAMSQIISPERLFGRYQQFVWQN